MEVVMALELFGNQRVAAFDILQEAFLSKDLEVRRRALSAMGRLGKGETAPREFLWQVLRSGDQELKSLAMNALRACFKTHLDFAKRVNINRIIAR
jgi:HEAT repeat protein